MKDTAKTKAQLIQELSALRQRLAHEQITERKQAEQALQKAYAELEQRVQERTVVLETTNTVLRTEVRERKRAKKALRQSQRRYQCLVENSIGLICTHNLDGTLLYVNPAALRALGYQPGEEAGKNLRDLLAPAVRPLFSAYLHQIRRNGTDQGLMQLVTKDGKRRVWQYCNTLHQENGHAPYVIGYAQDVTEQVQLEKALRESNERFDLAVQGVGDGVWEGKFVPTDAGYTLREVYFSPRCKALLGAEDLSDEDTFRHWQSLLHPEDRPRVLRALRKHLEHCVPYQEEYRLQTKDGEYRWFSARGQAGWNAEGQPIRMAGSLRDITAQKQLEEVLRERERLFDSFMNNSPAVAYMKDEDGRYVYLNRPFERLFNVTLTDWRDKTDDDVWPVETAKQLREHDKMVLAGDQTVELLETVPQEDGSHQWLTFKFPISDNTGRRFLAGISVDITERKQMEEALRQAHQEQEALINSIEGIVWEGDAQTFQFTFVSKTAERLLGYPVDRWINEPEFWRNRIHQKDQQWVIDACLEAMKAGQSHTIEYRMIAADGRTVWLHDLINLDVEQDQLRKVRGVMVDITARKQMEIALRESEAKYRTIFAASPDIIYLTDPDGNLLDANPALLTRSGTSLEQIRQMHVLDFFAGKNPEALQRVLAQLRAGEEIRDFTVQAQTLEGEVFVYEVNAIPITAGGKVVQILSLARDMTSRKRAEEELTQSREQLRHLAARLQAVREEERTQIARDIHDELGQTLTGLNMHIGWMAGRLRKEKPTLLPLALLERTRMMAQLVEFTIQAMSRISTDLRPGVLDDLGIVAALEWQAQDFQSRTGIQCEFVYTCDELQMAPEHATALFRIFQETLTNVARHAHATTVTVRLEEDGDVVRLKVCDNGRGITAQEQASGKALGLLGMQERAQLLGGTVSVEGGLGWGTTVGVMIPLNATKDKEDEHASDPYC